MFYCDITYEAREIEMLQVMQWINTIYTLTLSKGLDNGLLFIKTPYFLNTALEVNFYFSLTQCTRLGDVTSLITQLRN